MRISIRISILLVLLAPLAGCSSPAPVIPIEDFFRNPHAADFKISPDGEYLAYIGQYEGHNNIFLQEVGVFEPVRLTSSTDRDINRFGWGNADRVIFMQDNDGDENYRLYTIDLESRAISCLTDYDGVKTQIVDLMRNRPDEIIVAMNRRDPEALDPYLLNIVTGEMQLLAENPGNVRDWMADNDGVIRIAFAGDMLYRRDEASAFKKVLELGPEDTFIPHYFTPDNRRVYAYSSIDRDTIAIVEYDLESGREVRVLFEDPVYDAFGDDERDHFIYSRPKEGLLYALYTAERRKLHFFDDEAESIYGRLQSRFADYEIVFNSWTDDFSKIVVEVTSDRLPAAYYLYDAETDDLRFLRRVAPWLDEEELAVMEPITYEARDGLTIHGYLTLPKGIKAKNLPVIVHPHAGPQWRNSWGWDARTQFFANRGYAVLQVNFRGSEGYGKRFMKAGFKQWGLKMQDDITDGVLWLIERGIADDDRIAIFGWSFGGYAALAGVTFTPDLYACGIDLWGISNYFTFYDSIPPYWKPFLEEINERWGDAVADRQQMHDTSPVFHVERIKAPLLIVQSANDTRVRRSQSEQMVEELKRYGKEYEYVLIEGEGHALSDESKMIELMGRIEDFLQKHIGR